MAFAYNPTTDTLTLSGGTVETPLRLTDYAGDLDISADPIVIRDWTVVPVGGDTFLPDAQPVYGLNLAARIYGEKLDAPPFADMVRAIGQDAWGVLASSAINAGGLPNYLGPHRLSIITSIEVDNTGGTTWRFRLTQRQAQRITEAATNVYIVHCNLVIGDGTATVVSVEGDSVTYEGTLTVSDNATLIEDEEPEPEPIECPPPTECPPLTKQRATGGRSNQIKRAIAWIIEDYCMPQECVTLGVLAGATAIPVSCSRHYYPGDTVIVGDTVAEITCVPDSESIIITPGLIAHVDAGDLPPIYVPVVMRV